MKLQNLATSIYRTIRPNRIKVETDDIIKALERKVGNDVSENTELAITRIYNSTALHKNLIPTMENCGTTSEESKTTAAPMLSISDMLDSLEHAYRIATDKDRFGRSARITLANSVKDLWWETKQAKKEHTRIYLAHFDYALPPEQQTGKAATARQILGKAPDFANMPLTELFDLVAYKQDISEKTLNNLAHIAGVRFNLDASISHAFCSEGASLTLDEMSDRNQALKKAEKEISTTLEETRKFANRAVVSSLLALLQTLRSRINGERRDFEDIAASQQHGFVFPPTDAMSMSIKDAFDLRLGFRDFSEEHLAQLVDWVVKTHALPDRPYSDHIPYTREDYPELSAAHGVRNLLAAQSDIADAKAVVRVSTTGFTKKRLLNALSDLNTRIASTLMHRANMLDRLREHKSTEGKHERDVQIKLIEKCITHVEAGNDSASLAASKSHDVVVGLVTAIPDPTPSKLSPLSIHFDALSKQRSVSIAERQALMEIFVQTSGIPDRLDAEGGRHSIEGFLAQTAIADFRSLPSLKRELDGILKRLDGSAEGDPKGMLQGCANDCKQRVADAEVFWHSVIQGKEDGGPGPQKSVSLIDIASRWLGVDEDVPAEPQPNQMARPPLMDLFDRLMAAATPSVRDRAEVLDTFARISGISGPSGTRSDEYVIADFARNEGGQPLRTLSGLENEIDDIKFKITSMPEGDRKQALMDHLTACRRIVSVAESFLLAFTNQRQTYRNGVSEHASAISFARKWLEDETAEELQARTAPVREQATPAADVVDVRTAKPLPEIPDRANPNLAVPPGYELLAKFIEIGSKPFGVPDDAAKLDPFFNEYIGFARPKWEDRTKHQRTDFPDITDSADFRTIDRLKEELKIIESSLHDPETAWRNSILYGAYQRFASTIKIAEDFWLDEIARIAGKHPEPTDAAEELKLPLKWLGLSEIDPLAFEVSRTSDATEKGVAGTKVETFPEVKAVKADHSPVQQANRLFSSSPQKGTVDRAPAPTDDASSSSSKPKRLSSEAKMFMKL